MKLLILFLVVSLVSCTRVSKTEVSSLKFDFSTLNQKGTISADRAPLFPTDKEVCFGVNVVAADIAEKIQDCAPKLGIFGGFISEEKTLTVEVPFGKGREVQLYAYLPQKGTTCPQVDNENDADIDPTAVFQIGKLTDVAFDQPETKLPIPISYSAKALSIYSDLNMNESCLKRFQPTPIAVDPNAPIILKATLDKNVINSVGTDELLSIYFLIQSPAPPNELIFIHDSPNGNIENTASSSSFYPCTAANISTPGHICEKGTVDDYYGYKSFSASQWAPNGIYKIGLKVKNTLSLLSPLFSGLNYTINNHSPTTAPSIEYITINPDNSLVEGVGGTVNVNILVNSLAPPTFIEKTLKRPDGVVMSTGGVNVLFTNCSSYTSMSIHICFGKTASHWFYTFSDYIGTSLPNGMYVYSDIRVRNAGILFSPLYGSTISFSVSGNSVAP